MSMSRQDLLPDVTCPHCGRAGNVMRFSREETVTVRGLECQVEKVLRRCGACGAEYENTKDDDWRLDAYAMYREAKGLLTPARIRDWRHDYELKQAEVTALLGWGEVTLGRYENGALQTEAHDKQLADLMEPVNLAAAIAAHPEAMSDERRHAILARIRDRLGLLPPEDLRVVRQKYGLSEAEMERLIGEAPGAWGRWERGDALPGKATDTLLREMAANPDLVRSLLCRSGVESPAAQVVLHQIDEDVEHWVAETIRHQFGVLPGVDIEALVRVAAEEMRKARPQVLAGRRRKAA